MEDDATVLFGTITGDQFHESAPSVKSYENVIDSSVFKVSSEPCESRVPGVFDIRLRKSVFERMGGWIARSSMPSLSFCIHFRIQKIKLVDRS